MFRRWCAFFFISFGFTIAFAQTDPALKVIANMNPDSVPAGGTGQLELIIEIPKDYHVSDAESGLFSVHLPEDQSIQFGNIQYPKGEKDKWGTIYRDQVKLEIPVHISSSSTTGARQIPFTIEFQPCDEVNDFCLAPMTQASSFEVTILPGGNLPETLTTDRSISGRVTRALEQGSIIAFLLVFIGGVLTSLTPCVYPMIPITVAVIGAQATGGKMKGFVLSLFYVLGISITFSSLGILAATTGSLFGAITQHPAVQIVIAAIFFIMGLSMLGAFVVQLPASIRMKIQNKKRSGFLGALLTGIVAGLIVSPCVSPLLVAILTWVAKTGSVMLGFGLLFTFAWGIGVLFILLGTFSGVLKNLPRGGGWTEYIERIFGLILLVLALVFVRSMLPAFYYQSLWAVFLVVLGTFLGGFSSLPEASLPKQKIGKAIGFLLILIGSALLLSGLADRAGFSVPQTGVSATSIETSEESIWLDDTEEAFLLAAMDDRPVLIDFYADWCAACHELDEKTWPDPKVRDLMSQMIPVKLDLTQNNDRTRVLQNEYGIIGMPTVILYDAERNEMARFTGFQSPEKVVSILNQALEAARS
ncbi:protein-disulfide reductase DsbD [candidate division KSB1 bacterium]|nr:protein-disulfide reductase DsbD [candidate division KSB1 bacterium]